MDRVAPLSVRVEPSKALRCLTAGADNNSARSLSVWDYFVHARTFGIARAFLQEHYFAVLLATLLSRRSCSLTERLCLSSSPQAFRERLDPKLFSLAFYPKNCEVIFLSTIVNYIGIPVRRLPISGGVNSSAQLSLSNCASTLCSKPCSVFVIMS